MKFSEEDTKDKLESRQKVITGFCSVSQSHPSRPQDPPCQPPSSPSTSGCANTTTLPRSSSAAMNPTQPWNSNYQAITTLTISHASQDTHCQHVHRLQTKTCQAQHAVQPQGWYQEVCQLLWSPYSSETQLAYSKSTLALKDDQPPAAKCLE